MSSDSLHAAEVARFLERNPGFLAEHADIFSTVTVPHPRLPHVIPLGERQNLILRERVQTLELALNELRHQAARNEHISAQLHAWLAGLLAEPDARQLGPRFAQGLVREFNLQSVTLLAWQPALHVVAGPGGVSTIHASPLNEEWLQPLRQYTAAQSRPTCCATSTANQALAPLLATLTGDTASPAGSLAVVPLHALQQQDDGSTEEAALTTGLLILADSSRDRYLPNMDTLFLERIAQLAGAMLTRLDAVQRDAAGADAAAPAAITTAPVSHD
ncbi:DUF484 family protein [Kerstersia similis]|uniref:DUF484 family protein n=1 Tax=Kerstersia similis TaxID=206505 RepID=UPI0039EF767F